MYSTLRIKTWQPVIGDKRGPICQSPADALFDIFQDINEKSGADLSPEILLVSTLPFATLIDDWIDGDYVVFDSYRVVIRHYAEGQLEEMDEFEGY